jgi:hypothetical protein
MKRSLNRRKASVSPIPPQSVVRLACTDKHTPKWREDLGRVFRIGYYGPNDGLDCRWLVNDKGEYEQTTDHKFLYRYFDVIHFARDKNFYGRRRPQISPIRPADLCETQKRRKPTRG